MRSTMKNPFHCPMAEFSNLTNISNIQLSNYFSSNFFKRPELHDIKEKNIIQLIVESYNSCDEELKIDCQKAFIVTGGCSITKGFLDRVK